MHMCACGMHSFTPAVPIARLSCLERKVCNLQHECDSQGLESGQDSQNNAVEELHSVQPSDGQITDRLETQSRGRSS